MSIGQIVADAWAKALTELQPYRHVVRQLKDGREFYFQEHYTPETILDSVSYPTMTKTAHFHFADEVSGYRLYIQPRLRSEPTFRDIPSYWVPFDPSKPLPPLPPDYDPREIFTSSSMFFKLGQEKTS